MAIALSNVRFWGKADIQLLPRMRVIGGNHAVCELIRVHTHYAAIGVDFSSKGDTR